MQLAVTADTLNSGVHFPVETPAFDIGWKPLHIMSNVSASIASTITPAGPEKAEGIITSSYLKDPTDPQFQKGKEWDDWLAWMQKYHPKGDLKDNFNVYGYTVAQIPLGVFRLPYTTKINWDPVKDISYVLNVTGYAFGLVVPADSPLKTWTHFVAWAKANPGKLSYGSTGTMTSPHLTMELIAQQLGLELLHVPYKGSADLMQSILGGQIMAAADSTGFAPQVEAGKLRVLNTWGAERLAKFPDAPTLKELGLNLVQNSPFGIGAPKGTPAETVRLLNSHLNDIVKMPDVVEKMATFGALPAGGFFLSPDGHEHRTCWPLL